MTKLYSRAARLGPAAFLLAGLCLLDGHAAWAQLSGTYRVGSALADDPAGARTFQSLASAVGGTGLGAGVSGPVTLVLVDASYPLGAALSVPAPAGSSSTNTITIQPASGVTPVISGSVAGALVTLNGTDYLTINGNNGSGGQALTIRNSGNGAAVLLQNDATNNALRYLTLESGATGNSATVLFGTTTGTTGNDFNTVANCEVRDLSVAPNTVPSYGINSLGTGANTNGSAPPASANSDNTVQSCNVYNFTTGGISLNDTGSGSNWTITGNNVYQTAGRSTALRVIRVTYGSGYVISNNNVYQTAGTNSSQFYGIVMANGASGTITGNSVGGSAAGATGNALLLSGSSVVYGIFLSVGTATASSIQGNVVRAISSSSTNTFWGIDLQNGLANIGTTAGNTIGGSGSGQGISHAGTAYGVLIENAAVGTVQNNTVAGITTTVSNAVGSTQAGALAGVYVSGSGANTITGNTISGLSGNTTNQSSTATVSANTATPVAGVYVSGSGANTITGNTIGSLSSASTFVNNGGTTLATAAMIPLAGVYLLGSGASPVSGNQISGLAATGGAPVAGVYVAGNGALTISGNTINTLSGNTSTAAALWGIASTGSGAVAITNNTIGTLGQSGLSSNLYGIQANFTAGSNVSGNVLSNISYSGTATGQTVYGIFAGGSNTVSSNSVQNVTTAANNNLRGIFVGGSAGNTPTVTGNTVAGVQSSATGGANIAGLYVGSATSGAVLGTTTVSTNLVSNVGSTATGTGSPALTIAGLQLGASNSGAAATSVVERNRVWNVYGSTASTGSNADQVSGLRVQGSFSGTFANNQLSLAAGSASQVSYGILDASSGGGPNAYYYNTAYLAPGPAAVTNISYGFLRSNGTPPAVTLLDNVLYNGRTPASGTPALAIGTAATGTFSSNYNLLIAPNASVMGNYGNVLYSFADWKTQSGGDGSSLSERAVNVPAANLFADAASGNLDINPANPEAWYVNGNGVQVAGQMADYASAAAGRSTAVATGGTDIGADELTPTSTPPALTASGAPVAGGTQTFTLGGRTLAQLAWGSTGTVPTAVTARYYSGTNPPAPYAAGAPVANYYFDFTDGGTGSNYSYQPTLYYDPALLGTVPTETDQQIALRNADNSGYRAFPTTVSTAARSLALSNGLALSRLGTLAVGSQAQPLPVTLAAFAALRQGADAVLNWNSATELNSAGYEVQVSLDGLGFRALGFVRSQQPNSLTPQYYQYTDREAGKVGTRYYRLRQVDLGGQSAYSPVQAVAFAGSAAQPALLASPNPFAGPDLALTVTAARSEEARLTVLDAAGRPVLTQDVSLAVGSNQLTLPDLATLPAGLYLVQLATESGRLHTRVVKQ